MAHAYAAIIEISAFKEAPQRAVETVLRLAPYFGSVHIISETVTLRDRLYKTWPEHKKQLRKRRIQLLHHPKLALERIKEHVMIYIPPTAAVKEATFKLLDLRIRNIPRTQQPRHAIQPMICLDESSFSVWYMFLALVFCLDWWRNMFAGFTFHTQECIRAEEILQGYKRVIIHPYQSPDGWTWSLVELAMGCCARSWLGGRKPAKSDRSPLIYAKSNATCGPTPRLSGAMYFLHYMHRRKPFGPGWKWWLAFACFFYVALGVSWWGPIFMAILRLAAQGVQLFVYAPDVTNGLLAAAQFIFDPFSVQRIILIILFSIVHMLVLIQHVRWSVHTFWVPWTFPLLLSVMPLVLLWSRLYQAHETWEHDLLDVQDDVETLQNSKTNKKKNGNYDNDDDDNDNENDDLDRYRNVVVDDMAESELQRYIYTSTHSGVSLSASLSLPAGRGTTST